MTSRNEELEWFPAALMLSVVMKEPEYAGPTKDKLGAGKARPLVRDAFYEAAARQLHPPLAGHGHRFAGRPYFSWPGPPICWPALF